MITLTDRNFEEEVLKTDLLVFVYFWAPWCPPCKIAGPVIEELAKEYEEKIEIGKLNVDESPKMAQKYGIMSIPTVVVFKKGEEVKKQIGFPGKAGYEKLIKEVA